VSADFEMDAGETTEYGVTVTRTDPVTRVVSPVDVRTGELYFKMVPRSGTPVVTKSTASASEIDVPASAPGNVATIFFLTGDTAAVVVPTVFDYSLRLVENNGDVTDVARGKILVRPAIATGP